MVIKHVWGGGRCVFVCLDACVARREQMVETQQTVGEHHTDGEGKKKKKKRETRPAHLLSSSLPKTAHSRAP